MSVTSKPRLLRKLQNKAYRDAYVDERVKTLVPIQVSTLRIKAEKTQGQLAKLANTKQSAISRLEDPNYGNLSINTLLNIAHALDVALLIKFVPFSRILKEFEDLSPEALSVKNFEEEEKELESWASTESVNPSRGKNDKGVLSFSEGILKNIQGKSNGREGEMGLPAKMSNMTKIEEKASAKDEPKTHTINELLRKVK